MGRVYCSSSVTSQAQTPISCQTHAALCASSSSAQALPGFVEKLLPPFFASSFHSEKQLTMLSLGPAHSAMKIGSLLLPKLFPALRSCSASNHSPSCPPGSCTFHRPDFPPMIALFFTSFYARRVQNHRTGLGQADEGEHSCSHAHHSRAWLCTMICSGVGMKKKT